MNNSRSYLNLVFTIAIYTLVFLIPTQGFAQAVVPGFDTNVLPPNDDGSTGQVSVGFDFNFFGVVRNTLYVNNNGNVTLDEALGDFTPFDLTSTGRQIIAPFFADVDTRANSDPTRYGSGTFAGRPAFGVNWINVNCYGSTPPGNNSFQLILVDRSDVGPGDFDIVFNYDQILWETGTASGGSIQCLGGSSARAGFSNGTGDPGTFYELPGSGITGAFLNGGPNALITGSLNSSVSGRYIFQARNGNIPVPPAPTTGIPTLQEWALLLMGLVLGGLVWRQSRRNGRMSA